MKKVKGTFYFPSSTIIVEGVEKPNYIAGTSVFAEFDVKPPKGKRSYIAQADQSITTRWIKVRYIAGITSKWQFRIGNDVFNIVSAPIDEGMRHKDLYIEVEAVEP